ncbi:MAG: hypothetical protein QNJ81_15170 [Acidimicrobiia bacterium]|nr:hypothetical protein [Acidimicrobiia bacterium]
MRSISMLAALALVMAACSGDEPAETTTTAAPATTVTTAPATTTTAPPPETTVATTTTTTTTAAPVPTTLAAFAGPVAFDLVVKDETTPALPPTESGWDASFSYSPWVLHHEGRFHMFYTGWRVDVAIGYASSDDGLTFTRSEANPVLEIEEDIGGRTHHAEAPVVYVAEDGTWVMYYGLLQGKRFPAASIHRATAPGPEGPWTPDPGPIYVAGDDAWDTEAVPQSVAVADEGVFLYYDGRDGSTASTGLLFSADGVTFTPYDDPTTPYGSDPVIGVPGVQAWDGAGAGSPVVIAGDDGFEMFYVGFEGPDNGERVLRIGYAVSDDGRAWQRYADNPAIVIDTQSSAPGSLGFPWMGGLVFEDTYYLYYALAAGAQGVGVITGTVAR